MFNFHEKQEANPLKRIENPENKVLLGEKIKAGERITGESHIKVCSAMSTGPSRHVLTSISRAKPNFENLKKIALI